MKEMVESYDPDELIACPFDPVHMVQRKRMPYHIVKCKKVFPKDTGIYVMRIKLLSGVLIIFHHLVHARGLFFVWLAIIS